MISKQVGAFLAGMIVVAAGIGAFFIYDQQKGNEYEVEADTISGDKKTSDDPSSGFVSYDGQRYFLKYGSANMHSSSYSTFDTNYIISFNSNNPGILTGYVDNVRVNLCSYDRGDIMFYSGDNSISLETRMTDEANSGLALVKEMQFKFEPLEEKTDLSFTIATIPGYGNTFKTTCTGNIPVGKVVDVYVDNKYGGSFTLSNSQPQNVSINYSYASFTKAAMVIDNAVYYCTVITS